MKILGDNILSWLLFVTFACFPLYVVRCSTFSFCVSPIPFTLLEVLILITFFVWFFTRLKNTNIISLISDLKNSVPTIYQILISVFLLAGLVATVTSVNLTGALGHYRAFFIEPFLLFIIVFDYLKTTKNYKLIIYSLIFSGLWLALIAITEKIFGFNPGNPAEFLERGRVSAVYTSSNAIGLYLGPITVITLGYLVSLTKGSLTQLIKLQEASVIALIFAIFLAAHYASGSRGAYLGLIFSFIFIFTLFIVNKLNLRIRKLIFSFGIITILFLILSNFIFLFGASDLIKNDFVRRNFQAVLPRLCIWEGTTNLIKENALVGSGLRGFREVYPDFKTCNQETAIYPHNIFVNFWTELGFLGLISFLGICLKIFFDLVAVSRKSIFALGLTSYFVYLLIHGMFDVPYFNNDLSAQFWVIFALSLFVVEQKGI